ncbi:transmembrane protein, putative [Medicago truncatula]|uniref:Transmembrane protein, putative n=1 Tax=Medicago truncatula TaxID=3880 RepID=A0A072VH70_MEDTR|nr:transmembrane protein, putative [Medicago truncatula]
MAKYLLFIWAFLLVVILAVFLSCILWSIISVKDCQVGKVKTYQWMVDFLTHLSCLRFWITFFPFSRYHQGSEEASKINWIHRDKACSDKELGVLEVYADQGWSWYKVLVANWGQGIILAKGAVMSQCLPVWYNDKNTRKMYFSDPSFPRAGLPKAFE